MFEKKRVYKSHACVWADLVSGSQRASEIYKLETQNKLTKTLEGEGMGDVGLSIITEGERERGRE